MFGKSDKNNKQTLFLQFNENIKYFVNQFYKMKEPVNNLIIQT